MRPTIIGTEHEYGIFLPNVCDKYFDRSSEAACRMLVEAGRFLHGSRRPSGLLTLEALAVEYGIPLPRLERIWRDVKDMDEVLRIIGGSGDMLPNGARLYLDGVHPEYSTPECLDAYDLLASEKAGERIVERARVCAETAISSTIHIHKDNSDRRGASWASHENYLVTPELFSDLVRPHSAGAVHRADTWTLYLVTRSLWAGSGKVGSDHEGVFIPYQRSQRAEFMRVVRSSDTMERRAIINTRDRAYADEKRFRRLHVIVGDSNRCDVAIFLKVGVSALVLKMLEDDFLGAEETFLSESLVDPVDACVRVSCDGIRAELRFQDGRVRNALSVQREILRLLEAHAERNQALTECESDVLGWFRSVLDHLERDPEMLFGILDHITKRLIIDEQLKRQDASWRDPLALRLDFLYHSLAADGLFEHLYREGDIVRLVEADAIERAIHYPPGDTRAWLRGECIRRFPQSYGSWSFLNILDGGQWHGVIALDDPTRGSEHDARAVLDESETAGAFVRRWKEMNP